MSHLFEHYYNIITYINLAKTDRDSMNDPHAYARNNGISDINVRELDLLLKKYKYKYDLINAYVSSLTINGGDTWILNAIKTGHIIDDTLKYDISYMLTLMEGPEKIHETRIGTESRIGKGGSSGDGSKKSNKGGGGSGGGGDGSKKSNKGGGGGRGGGGGGGSSYISGKLSSDYKPDDPHKYDIAYRVALRLLSTLTRKKMNKQYAEADVFERNEHIKFEDLGIIYLLKLLNRHIVDPSKCFTIIYKIISVYTSKLRRGGPSSGEKYLKKIEKKYDSDVSNMVYHTVAHLLNSIITTRAIAAHAPFSLT